MQTAIIAGGAGFIGSHLCKSLIKDGFSVLCIDNLITGQKRNIESLLKDSNFKLIEGDVTEPLEIPGKSDFVFHLASPASPNKNNPKSYIQKPIETLLANSLGTYRLLELAKKHSAKFLYTSSSEVYGDPEISPQKEDYWGNVNPNGVRSVYDEGKRFSEAMVMAYFRKYNLDVRIIRIFNTYGPDMNNDGRVIPEFINQAINNKPMTVYGHGKQTRSLCFVDDMVSGLKKAMFLKGTSGEVINIGNPNEKTILDLAEIIKEMTKCKSEIIFEDLPQDDPKRRKPDISKAKKILDWEPKVDLRDGLEKTIEYFRSIQNIKSQ